MNLQDIKQQARQKFSGACRVCPICNGHACAGEVPGMGGLGDGSSFKNNIEALARWRLNLRTVHSVENPSTRCSLLGMSLAAPILGAAIGGISFNMAGALTEEDYDQAVVDGCRQAGVISMTGDGPKPVVFESGLKAVAAAGGKGIPIIKPREINEIVRFADEAANVGALAFGIDIDAAALVNMTSAGQKVGPKTRAELAEIKERTRIPFIVKGIMTAEDARECARAGVDGIVVSNHGGRALESLPGTAEVLPEIAQAVRGELAILVDGGIRSGSDILKMLALGAEGVLIGRPIAMGAVGGGAAGVQLVLEKFITELKAAMILTGTAEATDVAPEILRG